VLVSVAVPIDERGPEWGQELPLPIARHPHLRPRGIETIGPVPEPEDAGLTIAAVLGAGHEVEPAVAVHVRQLRTESGALSSRGDAAVRAEFIEPDRRGELGTGGGPDVAVESHPALGFADEQLGAAIAIKVPERGVD